MPYAAGPVGAVAGPDGIWTASWENCDPTSSGGNTQVFHWNGTSWSSSLVAAGFVTLAASGSRLWAAGISNVWFHSRSRINGKLTTLQLNHGAWTPPVTRGPVANDIVDGIAAVPGSATV
jgi:hypothetical protein